MDLIEFASRVGLLTVLNGGEGPKDKKLYVMPVGLNILVNWRQRDYNIKLA